MGGRRVEASQHDLAILKLLLQLQNAVISKATSNKMLKHFWYLSDKLVALSILYDAVPSATMQRTIAKLQGEGDEEDLSIRLLP